MKNSTRIPSQPFGDELAPGFTLETTRVIRDAQHFAFDDSGKVSIGQMLDAQIGQALERHEVLQDICIHFESRDWEELRRTLNPDRNQFAY